MVNHQTIGDRAHHRAPDHDTGPTPVSPRPPLPSPHPLAPPAPLSPEDLVALRENLQEQRLFREEQLRRIAVLPPGTDAGSEAGIGLAASARMVLADVEAALGRMAEGRYGRCHLCRRPVDRERLVIVPQARYCARCQQVHVRVRAQEQEAGR
ncbi:TraR/DksA family transcriptional regulator [Streptomyces sp. STCH 565 A]|uniref:TraR/DksA family transcriptional regulator n=1 Tax=Streptomyces sp. STCH 565 A TaxID=2950532 RepID=UPI0035B4F0ED